MKNLIVLLFIGLFFNSCNFGEINITGHKKKTKEQFANYLILAPNNTIITYYDEFNIIKFDTLITNKSSIAWVHILPIIKNNIQTYTVIANLLTNKTNQMYGEIRDDEQKLLSRAIISQPTNFPLGVDQSISITIDFNPFR